jgi:hypothetical protein
MQKTIRAHPRIAPCLYPTIRSLNTSFDPCIEKLLYDSLGRLERIDSYVRLVTSYMIEYREEWMTGRSYISEKALNAQREDLVSEQRVVVF